MLLDWLGARTTALFGSTWGPVAFETVTSLVFIVCIVVPLMLERWAIAWRSGAADEPDDVALSKSRRAA